MRHLPAIVFLAIAVGYTTWCAAYGPPYRDAYGLIVHAAYERIVR